MEECQVKLYKSVFSTCVKLFIINEDKYCCLNKYTAHSEQTHRCCTRNIPSEIVRVVLVNLVLVCLGTNNKTNDR